MNKGLILSIFLSIALNCVLIAQVNTAIPNHDHFSILPSKKLSKQYKKKMVIDELAIATQMLTKQSSVSLPYHSDNEEFTVEEFKYYDGDINPVKGVRTYRLYSKNNPLLEGRMVAGPSGINIMYLDGTSMTRIYYDNEENGHKQYYQEHGFNPSDELHAGCTIDHTFKPADILKEVEETEGHIVKSFGNHKRVFRVAIVTSGEYYKANGNNTNTVRERAVQNLVDISFIYEREVNVHMIMARNSPKADYNDELTDPFNPSDERTSKARQEVEDKFNNRDYDIGHLFHTHPSGGNWLSNGGGSGGVAQLSSVCRDGGKAAAWSGSFSNNNNGFVSLAAHEFGHQYGCPHTFSGDGGSCQDNISLNNSYEMASGVTIMSYSGICGAGQNVLAATNEGDDVAYNFFHATSLNNIKDHLESDVAADCNVDEWILDNNSIPVANANPCGAVFSIPTSTPFFLRGVGTDADGDTLLYSWEQFDVGNADTQGDIGGDAAQNTRGPIFRCYPPNGNPVRHFPKRSSQLEGFNVDEFEVLPRRARSLAFRFLVRDNAHEGSAVDWDQISMNVVTSSFGVTSPDDQASWTSGSTAPVVTWETTGAENICDNVDIKLSLDGGASFPIVLKRNVAFNVGSGGFELPAGIPATDEAKIMVVCSDYECFGFYDMSETFTISSGCASQASAICNADPLDVDFRDPSLNFGKVGVVGHTLKNILGEVDNAGPTMTTVLWNSTRTSCATLNNSGNAFNSIEFSPTKSGRYFFEFESGSSTIDVHSIFEKDGFSTSSPCGSFVASNAEKSGGSNYRASNYMYVDLEACKEYYFISHITMNNNFDLNVIAIEGSGSLIGAESVTSPLAYIALDTNSGLISAQNTTGDFTTIDPGNYRIYSVAYETSSPASWVGQGIDQLSLSDDCLVVSENYKPININASCAIVDLQASISSACSPLSNNYSIEVSFSIDLGPTSGGATISTIYGETNYTLTSGTNTVTLDHGLLADGQPLDLRFSFDNDNGCIKIEQDVIVAPENCCAIRVDLGDQRLCTGETAILDAGNDGINYEWMRDGESLQSSGSTFQAVDPGLYTVVVTDINGCSKSDQTVVAFDTPPDLMMVTEDVTEACQGDRIRIEAAVTIWDSIAWYRNGSLMDPALFGDRRVINIFDSGLYEIKAFNGGCERSDFISVDIKQSKPFTMGEDIKDCLGETIVLDPECPDLDYEWLELGSIDVIATSNTLTLVGNTEEDGGRFVAVGTGDNGCAHRDTVRVDFEEAPILDLGEDREECDRVAIRLDAETEPVNWYLDGELVLGYNQRFLYDVPTALVVVEVVQGNCTTTDTVNVIKNPGPVLDLGPDMSFCEGTMIDTFVYAGPNSNDFTYAFNINGGGLEPGGIDGTLEITEAVDVSVTVTRRDNGCKATDNISIVTVSNPEVNIESAPTSICEENGFGTITATASSDAVTWLFDGEVTSFTEQEIEITEPGTYTIGIGLGQQCEASSEVVVASDPSPDVELPPLVAGCIGVPETLVASQNTIYTYAWLYNNEIIPGAISNTYVAEEPGVYIVIAANDVPCQSRDTVLVTFENASTVTLPNDETVCDGSEFSISALTSAPELTWYNGTTQLTDTGRTIDVTTPGTYIAIYKEGEDCEARDSMVVSFSDSPEAILDDLIVCEGLDAVFTAGADDAFAYTWYINDEPQSNQSGTLIVKSDDIMGLTADIRVDVKNTDNDCFDSATASVTFTSGATVEIVPPAGPFCEGTVVRLETMTNQTALTWTGGGDPIASSDTTIEISESGRYIAIAGSGTCSMQDTFDIVFGIAPVFSILSQSVCQGEDAVFDAGTDSYAYQWFLDNDELAETGSVLTVVDAQLPAGTGEVRVVATDSGTGCTADTTVVVEFITTPTLTLEPPATTCEGDDAIVTANLLGATTLEWSFDGDVQLETGTTFTATQTGTYSAKAGSGDCAVTQSVDLVFTDAPEFRIEKQSVCQGDDAVFDAGNMDYTYQWFLDNDQLAETGSVLTVDEDQLPAGIGEIRVIATDSGTGCTADTTVVIEFISTPTLSLEPPATTCIGEDAIITANLVGAASLEWTFDGDMQSETATTFIATQTGTYSAKAGSGDCAVTQTLDLTFTSLPDISVLERQSVCQGEDAVFDAGNPDYSYEWFLDNDELSEIGSVLTIEESQLPAGNGEVRVIATDRNSGCFSDTTVTIEFITTPTLTLDPPATTCIGEDAIITANLLGAASLEWTFDGDMQSETGTTFTATQTGTYSAKAGSGDCAVTQTLDLTFTSLPDISVLERQSVCQGDDAVFDAGNPDYSYEWFLDNDELSEIGSVLTIEESQLQAGNGEVRVIATDRNSGCFSDTTVTIEFITTPTLTLDPPATTCIGEDAIITANLLGAASLEWTFDGDMQSETGTTFIATQTGTYSAKAGSGDCAVTQTLDLTFTSLPDISVIEKQSVCQGEPAVFDAGNPDYMYQWFLDNDELAETGSMLSVEENQLPAGNGEIRVIATDRNSGCFSDTTVVIEFITTPTLSLDPPASTCIGEDAIILANLLGAASLEWTFDGDMQSETGTTFTATQSGMYSAKAGSGDCAVTQSIDLTFTPRPDVSMVVKQSVCEGDDAVFNAGNPDYAYQWFLDNDELAETGSVLTLDESQLPAGSGMVRVVAIDTDTGCENDTTVVVEFISTPTLTINDPETACEGEEVTIEANLAGAASLEWSFEGDVQMETGTSLMATRSGIYTATAGSGLCAVTESITLEFNPVPDATLGDDKVGCAGEDIDIDLTSDNTDNIAWAYSDTGMNPTVIAGESGEAITVDEAGFYTVTVTSDAGCSDEETIEVAYIEFPEAEILNLPMGVCAGTDFEVMAETDAQSFFWSDTDGPIPGATNDSQEFSQSGLYLFTAINSDMATGTECPVEVPFDLDFIPAPQFDLGDDIRICEGETVTLSIPAMLGVTYEWYLEDVIQPDDGNSIEATTSGKYELVATNDIGCDNSDIINIEFVEIPTITTNDQVSFCSGETETLAITTDAPLITWTLGGQVVGTNTQTLDVTVGGIYTVEVSTPEDCGTSTTIEVTEIMVDAISFPDIELCPGDDPIDVGVTGDFDTYNWSGGATGSSISIPYLAVTSLTTETVTVEASKGGCASNASFTVTYFPVIDAMVFNDNVEICVGQEIQLDASGGSVYEWSDPNGSLNNTTVSNPIASPTETTIYEVMISDICPNGFESVTVTVNVNALPEANAGEDRSVIPDKTIMLEASGGTSYRWDNEDLIEGSSSIANPEVSIEEATTFTVTVTDENGCSATDEVLVDIVNDPSEVIEVVDAFSPNGDEANEMLEFRGLELFPVNKLTIFNRWGNVVFEKRNYQNDEIRWDGTRNGELLPAATYYYILEFDDFKVKNSLTLVRE